LVLAALGLAPNVDPGKPEAGTVRQCLPVEHEPCAAAG
jgi:hypothetical protein